MIRYENIARTFQYLQIIYHNIRTYLRYGVAVLVQCLTIFYTFQQGRRIFRRKNSAHRE